MSGNSRDPGYIRRRITPLFAVSKIVTIHYFEFSGGFVGPRESHDFWEFVYVDKGNVVHLLEREELTLRQGEFLVIAPGRTHQLCVRDATNPNVFIISFVCHSKAMNRFRNRVDRLPEQLKPCIAGIIGEARQTYNLSFNDPGMLELLSREDELPGGQQMIQLNLQQLLIHLYRAQLAAEEPVSDSLSVGAQTGNDLVDRMIRAIQDGVCQPISARTVCEPMGYTHSYLTALFRRHCGCSIAEYINRVKIREARELIRRGNSNFSEIAARLCYSDQHFFSRVFRRVTGMSPSEYRRSLQL